ncbi:MAG: lytic transglycosylase domain-containing protein [Roseovarius sp.]
MQIIRTPAFVAAALAGLLAPVPGLADPPAYPDFTFKMEKPPKAGQRKLITVQIAPRANPAVPELPAKPQAGQSTTGAATAALAPLGAYGWYWNKVPPALGADPAARMLAAFDSLDKGPGGARVGGPRLQTLQTIASAQGANILRATVGTRVSPALVLAVIAVESGGRVEAESHKGAQGLMQLMPDTATRFGVTDSLSPAQNIAGGVKYLDWLLGEFKGDAVLALAGYNAGEGSVKKHEGVPPFAETRDYVPKVLAAFDVARGLCKTRPELVTDACALNLAAN